MGEWTINALKRVALLSLRPALDIIERNPEMQAALAGPQSPLLLAGVAVAHASS